MYNIDAVGLVLGEESACMAYKLAVARDETRIFA
jgi:hypothetical protein